MFEISEVKSVKLLSYVDSGRDTAVNNISRGRRWKISDSSNFSCQLNFYYQIKYETTPMRIVHNTKIFNSYYLDNTTYL